MEISIEKWAQTPENTMIRVKSDLLYDPYFLLHLG